VRRPRRALNPGCPRLNRISTFQEAVADAARARGATALFTVETDVLAAPALVVPIPAVSATMDNGVLLRTVELNSRLRRLVSVLKARQSAIDPAIREFAVGANGIDVGEPIAGAARLLTGEGEPTNGAA